MKVQESLDSECLTPFSPTLSIWWGNPSFIELMIIGSIFFFFWFCFLWFRSLICFLYWVGFQWTRSPGKQGSHFNPYSDLFAPNERKDVITSTVCWTMMLALLVCISFIVGPVQVLKIYGVPYWVSPIFFMIITVPSDSLFPNFVFVFTRRFS